jgi:hypothetical protein
MSVTILGVQMPIVLFYCEHCRQYIQHGAVVDVTVKAKVDARRAVLLISELPVPVGHVSFKSAVHAYCPKCNRLTELIAAEECPEHMWDGDLPDKSRRACVLCGMEQQGRVVFDE